MPLEYTSISLLLNRIEWKKMKQKSQFECFWQMMPKMLKLNYKWLQIEFASFFMCTEWISFKYCKCVCYNFTRLTGPLNAIKCVFLFSFPFCLVSEFLVDSNSNKFVLMKIHGQSVSICVLDVNSRSIPILIRKC